jgi:NADH-quinone oxidoreductase subunit C
MTPDPLGAHIVAAIPGASAAVELDELTVWVPVGSWVAAATLIRDDAEVAADWLDLLTAWDELREGDAEPAGFVVVLQAFSLRHKHRVRLATRVTRESPSVPTLTGVYPGVDWHERETAEMFGITFDGHPNPVPLLLPDAVVTSDRPHPLRKEVVLAAREERPWPGEVEP